MLGKGGRKNDFIPTTRINTLSLSFVYFLQVAETFLGVGDAH
jgi:hypothetical protein